MRSLLVPRSAPSTLRAWFRFTRGGQGFAAAEAVLLAVVLIGISLGVARVLVPAARDAALKLHGELAGGVRRSS